MLTIKASGWLALGLTRKKARTVVPTAQTAYRLELLKTVSDAPAVQVINRELNRDLIAGQDLNVVHTHLARDVGQDFVTILKFYLEHSVR